MQSSHDGAYNAFFQEITCAPPGQGLNPNSFRTQRVANNVSHLLGGKTTGLLSLFGLLFDIVG